MAGTDHRLHRPRGAESRERRVADDREGDPGAKGPGQGPQRVRAHQGPVGLGVEAPFVAVAREDAEFRSRGERDIGVELIREPLRRPDGDTDRRVEPEIPATNGLFEQGPPDRFFESRVVAVEIAGRFFLGRRDCRHRKDENRHPGQQPIDGMTAHHNTLIPSRKYCRRPSLRRMSATSSASIRLTSLSTTSCRSPLVQPRSKSRRVSSPSSRFSTR